MTCTLARTMTLPQYIAEQIGLSADLVSYLLLGAAALIVALGAALLGLAALSMGRDRAPSAEDNWRMVSKLLPLLAQDTLDADLRAIYQKSLYLDALVADVAPSLTSPTGTQLGKQTRRELLAIESMRFGDPDGVVDTTDLEDLCARMDEAIDHAERARPAAQVDLHELAEILELPESTTSERKRLGSRPNILGSSKAE